MARTPQEIPREAAERWAKGDERGAELISGLKSRQLRNRLGAPGRRSSQSTASSTASSPPSAARKGRGGAAKGQRGAIPGAPSPASAPEPTSDPSIADIERLDTREEAEAVYREIRGKMPYADEVRYASLAEKALAALNRIEQIDRRRPQAPAPDEVTRRLVEVKDRAILRMGLLLSEAVTGGGPL